MSENFLSRWSKRKLEVREQEKQADRLVPDEPVPIVAVEQTPVAVTEREVALPTEADLQAVEQGGDIKAFLVDKVSPELKNKAFKALFSRAEFNVMDGLDIYIDDYNKFTPLSPEDIGKMSLSKQLLSRPDLDVITSGETIQVAPTSNAMTDNRETPVLNELQGQSSEEEQVSVDVTTSENIGEIPYSTQPTDLSAESENSSLKNSL